MDGDKSFMIDCESFSWKTLSRL